MKFNLINVENWDRKPYFDHYFNDTRCTFSLTANIDITQLLQQLQKQNLKFYPALIYMITRVVNTHVEYRTCLDEQGRLGYWEEMSPSYTIFHNDDKSFSDLWTDYHIDFPTFYKRYLDDIKRYGDVKAFSPKDEAPPNLVSISCLPWTSFTGFNLNIFHEDTYLLPIITGGKYFKQDDKVLLPIAFQAHHAVCDGYHASRFYDELQQLADRCDEWLISQ